MLTACGPKVTTGHAEKEIDNHGATEIIKVDVTLEDGKVTEITIDETYNGQTTTKRTLGADYGMTKASPIGKEWHEQADYLQTFIVENGIDAVTLNESGYPTGDLTAGCTINLTNIVATINDAIAAAK
jgi:hypothetical protein